MQCTIPSISSNWPPRSVGRLVEAEERDDAVDIDGKDRGRLMRQA